jgi:hypothetical protein
MPDNCETCAGVTVLTLPTGTLNGSHWALAPSLAEAADAFPEPVPQAVTAALNNKIWASVPRWILCMILRGSAIKGSEVKSSEAVWRRRV